MAEGATVQQSIDEKLDYVSRLTERVLIKLFGDVDAENPNGRIPRLEAKQIEHDKRIRSLEKTALKLGGALGLLAVLAGLVEAAAHLASAVKH
jgi:hypothetical protein